MEIVVILAILVLLFGRRLPEIARSVGKSFTEFKKGLNEAKDTQDDVMNDVRKAKDDIVDRAKDAAGLSDSDKND
jgi:sec-independent protein translocase protein TatA